VLLDGEVVEIIRDIAIGIEERYAIEKEAMGMDKDHIHILCGGHPKLSPEQIVWIFKSITAREIFRKKPTIKKELWGRGVLDGWILCSDSWSEGKLGNSGKFCTSTREIEGGTETDKVILSFDTLQSCRRVLH